VKPSSARSQRLPQYVIFSEPLGERRQSYGSPQCWQVRMLLFMVVLLVAGVRSRWLPVFNHRQSCTACSLVRNPRLPLEQMDHSPGGPPYRRPRAPTGCSPEGSLAPWFNATAPGDSPGIRVFPIRSGRITLQVEREIGASIPPRHRRVIEELRQRSPAPPLLQADKLSARRPSHGHRGAITFRSLANARSDSHGPLRWVSLLP